MAENETLKKLLVIQDKVFDVKSSSRKLNPSLSLVFNRKKVRNQQVLVDQVHEQFLKLNREILARVQIPRNVNDKLIVASNMSILNCSISSIHTLIGETYQELSALNSQLNFYSSLVVALLALLVSIIAILLQWS
jgi:hypothetical protein